MEPRLPKLLGRTRAKTLARIDWRYPAPRRGWRGILDRTIGPGASRGERRYVIGGALAAGLAMLMAGLSDPLNWNFNGVQIAVAVILAIDLAGSAIAYATSAGKRWYHRFGQRFRQQFGRAMINVFHIGLAAWVFLAGDFGFFIGASFFLMAGCLTLLWTPLHLQRVMAMVLFVLGLALSFYAWPMVRGMEWFLPMLLLKVFVAYLPREEPYRAAAETPLVRHTRVKQARRQPVTTSSQSQELPITDRRERDAG